MNNNVKQFNFEFLTFILCIAITLFNTVYLQQDTVAILSIPQFLLVFFFLFKKDYRTAFLLHITFVVACVSWGTAIEGGPSAFLYTNSRVYGPFTLNIIILSYLWVAVQRMPVKVKNDSLLLLFRKIILYFLISGSFIGALGCICISGYQWQYWIYQFLFVLNVYLFIDIYIHLYNEYYSKLTAIVAICLMAAAPIASVVSFTVFGVHSYYGMNDEIPFSVPIIGLTPCLLIALFQLKSFKLKLISLFGLIFYAIHLMIVSRGSQFLDVFVVILLLIYLVYFKKGNNFQLKSLRVFLPILIIFALPFAIDSLVSSSDVTSRKYEQFMSLFTIFNISGNGLVFNIDEVGRSPYIRLAELANIVHECIQYIFPFFFGKGYGGYYTDSLNLFAGIDLTLGAFSDEIVAGGRFYNAHSAIPSVLHFNGFVGLFFMLKIAFSYLRRVDRSFLVFAAFMLFILSFYFDIYGCFSFIMALCGGEYFINDASIDETYNNKYLDSKNLLTNTNII